MRNHLKTLIFWLNRLIFPLIRLVFDLSCLFYCLAYSWLGMFYFICFFVCFYFVCFYFVCFYFVCFYFVCFFVCFSFICFFFSISYVLFSCYYSKYYDRTASITPSYVQTQHVHPVVCSGSGTRGDTGTQGDAGGRTRGHRGWALGCKGWRRRKDAGTEGWCGDATGGTQWAGREGTENRTVTRRARQWCGGQDTASKSKQLVMNYVKKKKEQTYKVVNERV